MVVIDPVNVVFWSSNPCLSLRVSLFHNYQYVPCEVVELCKVFSQGPVLSSSSIYSSLCMMLQHLCLSLSYREL